MSGQRGAIFDLDGTLIDSCAAHERAWVQLGESIGIPVSREFFLTHFGRQNTPILLDLFESAAKPTPGADEIAALAARKESNFRDLIVGNFPVMAGTCELLAVLRHSGWRLAIGSSAPQANVDFMLERLGCGSMFDAIVTGDCVVRSKPYPDVFLEGAKRLGLKPEACVVIEDAAPGIAAAHAAGMRCIALCSAGHTPQELAQADLLVHTLGELTHEHFISLTAP